MRSRVLLFVALLLGAGLLVGGYWLYTTSAPHLRYPDRPVAAVEKRWERVRALARFPAPDPEEQGKLAPVLDALAIVEDVEGLDPYPDLDAPPPPFPRDELPAAWQDLFARLRAWDAADGRSGWPLPAAIGELGPSRGLLRLANVVPVVEPLPRADAAAVLRLAWLVRREGTLLDFLVGLKLARDVGERLAAAGSPPHADPELARWAPRRDAALPAFCREAVHMLDLVEDQIEGTDPGTGLEAALLTDREIVVHKELTGTALLAAAEADGDLHAMRAAVRHDPDGDLQGLLHRMLAGSPSFFTDVADELEKTDRLFVAPAAGDRAGEGR